MIVDAIFDRTNQVLDKAMSLRMARHNLLASNIANAETPNYRAVDIDFKATMDNWLRVAEAVRAESGPQMELQRTDEKHFSLKELSAVASGEPDGRKIVFAAGDDESVGNDNNTVSLEVQLARMKSNATSQAVLAQLMRKRLGSITTMLDRLSRE